MFLIGRELWGPHAGPIGMTLYLLTDDVHGMARQYHPDPWMLASCVAGLCLFALSQTRHKRWFVPLAGTMCGLGTLCKLFGDERLERQAYTRRRPRLPYEPSGSLGRPRRGQDESSTRDC